MSNQVKPRYAMQWARTVKLENDTRKSDPELIELAKKMESVISPDEKDRRKILSYLSGLIFVITLSALIFFNVPRIYRIVLFVPILATYIFQQQSRNGMCGISLKGSWDPDSCGIRKIEDDDLREKIMRKGSQFFKTSFLYAAILTIPFLMF